MPASGRGANLDLSRRIGAPRPKPPVPSTARPTSTTSSANLRAPVSTHPFQQAVTQSAQAVARATPRPAAKVPILPRVANPTPAQTHAALQLIHKTASRAIGPNPTPQSLAAYQRELHSNPSNADFVKSIEHYTAAAQQHVAQAAASAAAALGQRAAGSGLLSPKALTPLQKLVSSAENDAETTSVDSRNAAIARGEANPRQAPGVGINVPGAGEINLSNIAATLANVHIAPKGIVGNVVNEAIDLPAQTFLSSAIAGSAARSAVEGKPKALEGIGQGVLSQVEHPIRSFKEAPLSTALTFAGGEAAVGGALGKLARAGAVGDRAAELASTVRPDLKLYGDSHVPVEGPAPAPAPRPDPKAPFRAPTPLKPATGRPQIRPGLRVEQTYNKDPLRKAAQALYEKALPKLPGNLRQADPFQAEGWRLQRNASGGGLTRVGRVDRVRAAGEQTRRRFVKGTTEQVAQLRPKEGEHAVPLIAQGIVRTPGTLVADLRKEAAKLRGAQDGLSRSQLHANKANLGRVEDLLANKKFLADPSEAFHAAARYRQIQAPLEAILIHGGVLKPDQVRAKLFPYAQAHMGALYDGQALRDVNGRQLLNEQIQAHMKANGVQDVGFISHKSGIDSSSSFYQATTRQPGLEKHARTGSAFSSGVADHSYEGLTGSIANQASRAAALEVRARELNLLALKPRSGGFASQDAARAYAKELQHAPDGARIEGGLGKLVPVHLGSDPILAAGNVHPADIQGTLDQFGLSGHESAVSKSNGKYGLIPEHVQNRLAEHDNAVSAKTNLKRAAQTYQQGFRRAKLNTSTRHIAGVVQEQGIRLGMEGAGVQAKRTGKLFLQSLHHAAELDHHGHLLDDAGPLGGPMRELEGQLGTRGGQVASQKANNVVRKGQAWSGSDFAASIARGADGAAHSTVGSAILKPWHAWQHVIEGGLSKVEESTHQAMLGKALKDSGFIGSYRSALKLQDQGMQELVKGGLTPNKADQLARSVDDMLGNWSHQTPAVRNIIGNYAPFGLWWLNSMRWLYRLPVTHPVKTGILAALYHATKEERAKKGQGFGAPGAVPAFLQGAIDTHLPIVGAVQAQPSYYSPGGTLGPEAFNTALEQFVPALQGLASAAQGVNPLSHAKLTDAKGSELGPLQIGTNLFAEAAAGPVPFATQAQQLAQKGGKPYGTANWVTDLLHELGGPSQVKPGTERPLPEVLTKILSPVRFAYQKKGSSAVNTRENNAHHERRKAAGSALESREALAEERPEAGPSAALSAREALTR